MNLNNVTIAGNLTGNPELKYLQSGMAVCNFRLANNLKKKDGTSKTTFIDCTAWDKTAEVAGQYLTKGSPVLLEGRLDLEEWDDKKTGDKRSKHIITVNRLHLFPSARPAELAGQQSAPASSEIPFDGVSQKPSENPFA